MLRWVGGIYKVVLAIGRMQRGSKGCQSLALKQIPSLEAWECYLRRL